MILLFKIKSLTSFKPLILERKGDDTKMSKEDFLAMVDQSRDRKEVKISREEMRQRLLK